MIRDPNGASAREQSFTFDRSYSSFDSDSPHFVSQEDIFEDLGQKVLENAWKGYNASIFSYGQTGSGKTFSTFGSPSDPGIVPRLCRELFARIDRNKGQDTIYRVEASMMEIYAERVRDLFDPTNPRNASGLKIRENSRTGPYAEGLCINYVRNVLELEEMLDEGVKYKTMASTNMNENSSRSHTIFQLYLTQTSTVGNKKAQRRSVISLVDLAGSERQDKAQTSGQRLKEGAAINLSLSMLGNVINALAENKKGSFVPYRNSVLTYLLKESLGGNSRTIMLSTISPAASNFSESLSTLNYSNRAKNIKNKARVNEDSTSKIVNELKAQIEELTRQLAAKTMGKTTQEENERLRQQLEDTQRIMEQMRMTDSEREEQAELLKQKRRAYLQKAGLFIEDTRQTPHIVNLNEDLSMNECLLYFFRKGMKTNIGSDPDTNDIILQGPKIETDHCFVENDCNEEIFITPRPSADVYVNGKKIMQRTQLNSSDRLIIGTQQVFRFSNPLKPSSDNKVVDVEMAREEIEKEIHKEFEEKRELKQQELNVFYEEKRSEHEYKIQELENRRQQLLSEIQSTQQQQLETVARAQHDTKEMQRLEEDVELFQQKLLAEQHKQQQMERESKEKADELSKMRDNLRLLAQSLQNEQKQREHLQQQHNAEKTRLQEEQRKIKQQADGMSAQLNQLSKEKEELAFFAKKHKEDREKTEKEYHANLSEQAELLPVLQNMMMEQERSLRSRIDQLSHDLTQKTLETDDLKEKNDVLRKEKINEQDEFIAKILDENSRLKKQMHDMRSRKPMISTEEMTKKLRALQQEIQRYRAEKIEHERRQIELEMKLNQKEAIIRTLVNQDE